MKNSAAIGIPILLLALNLSFTSCKKQDALGFKTYTIKEGKHYSNHGPSPFHGDEMDFSAKFNETAVYQTVDPTNQEDINKLQGFSDCSSAHHHNSARFGWRWFNNEIEIFAYCYADKDRSFKQIGVSQFNVPDDYKIIANGNEYIFWFNQDSVHMARGCDGDGGLKYKLYPYFGGDEKAPHKIEVMIKD